MNSFSVGLTQPELVVTKFLSRRELEFFVISYLSSPDFDFGRAEKSKLIDEGAGVYSLTTYDVQTYSWLSPFKFDYGVGSYIKPIALDTSSTKSFQTYTKPYAVAGRIVAMTFIGTIDDSFITDVGDYIVFTFSMYNNTTGEDTNCFVVLSQCNSTLTDAYTPFNNVNYKEIIFLDLMEVMQGVSNSVPDAVINNALNNGTFNAGTMSGVTAGAANIINKIKGVQGAGKNLPLQEAQWG